MSAAVARKDLRSEWRSRDLLPALVQFIVLALLVANFGFDIDRTNAGRIAPGILWLTLMFAGLLTFGRTFSAERDQSSLEAMLLSGASPAALFLGKAAAAGLLLLAAETVLLPALALFFGTPLVSLPLLLGVLLATVGMSALGCLFAALAAQTRARDLLLPVLALPLWIPLVVAGGRVVQLAMGTGAGASTQGLVLLLDFDILFVVAASLAARFVLDD